MTNPYLKSNARILRKGMTEPEKLLWSKIRRKQLGDFQFYRQKVIGNYIADFFCHKASLVVEVDGGQHYTPEGLAKDKIRDEYMESLGFKVLRFKNNEVFGNIDGVVEVIRGFLNPSNSLCEREEKIPPI